MGETVAAMHPKTERRCKVWLFSCFGIVRHHLTRIPKRPGSQYSVYQTYLLNKDVPTK